MKTVSLEEATGPAPSNAEKQRVATVLKEFGEIEADSAWQYLQAITLTDDVNLKKTLFKNVLEERDHAEIFQSLSRKFANFPVILPAKRRQCLVSKPEKLSGFLAFVHYSEKCVHRQFQKYANSIDDPRISKAFQKISEDEEGHESEIYEHLRTLVVSDKVARRKVLVAKIKREFQAFNRRSQRIGDFIFTALLAVVFWVSGFLMKLIVRK